MEINKTAETRSKIKNFALGGQLRKAEATGCHTSTEKVHQQSIIIHTKVSAQLPHIRIQIYAASKLFS